MKRNETGIMARGAKSPRCPHRDHQRPISLCTLSLLSLSLISCLRGPSFMNNTSSSQKNFRQPAESIVDLSQNSGTPNRVILTTSVEGAKATAKLDSKSQNTQVILASPNSSLSGSQVEFPPGVLAIDTEVSVQPGYQVATTQTIQSLAVDTQVLSKTTPIAVTSSIAIDTESPFTVSLPIPNTTSLLDPLTSEGKLFLEGGISTNPLDRLVVFFNVQIAAENRAVQGIIPRTNIEIVNGYARILTKHFGTFQAAILSKKIETQVQAPANPLPIPPDNAIAETPAPRRYYIKGARTIGSSSNTTIQTWIPMMTPARVTSSTTTLMSGVASYPEL